MNKKLLLTLSMLLLPIASYAAQGQAEIKGTAADSKITGTATFTPENDGLVIEASVANVPPGKHGFHIHENGSCAEAGKAAGGHFNPDKVDHGLLPKNGHMHSHAGDMGNIEVASDGTGKLKMFLQGLTLKDGKYAIEGKSLILHEKEDDFSQPTGNAGGRIGCGVIEIK